MKFSRFFIVFLTILTIFSAHAEYLVFKKDASGSLNIPSLEEYKKAFPVLEKYQFPRSLAHKEDLLRELSPEQLTELANHEQEFIQRKLDDLHENMQLVYIPTTLWELVIIHQLMYEIIEKPDLWTFGTCLPAEFKSFLESASTTIDRLDLLITAYMVWNSEDLSQQSEVKFIGALKNHFESTAAQILGFLTNRAVIQTVGKYISTFNNPSINDYKNVATVIGQSFKKNHKKVQKRLDYQCACCSLAVFNYLTQYDLTEICKKLIAHELESNATGSFLIYRGTNGYQDALDKYVKHTSFSGISYGNSFFAGALFDADILQPGCAFFYFVRPDLATYFYTVSIPKKDVYMNNPKFDVNSYFSIPPVTTASGLCAKGEAFHPRAFTIKRQNPDAEVHEQNFQQFLAARATVFPKAIGGSARKSNGSFV